MKIGNLEVYGIIYKIINIINGKVYIGQTINNKGFNGRYAYTGIDIEKVYKYHKYRKENNIRYNDYLLKSIEKYGFSSFEVFNIYDIAFSQKELDIKEDLWINYYDCIINGYNWKQGGVGGRQSDEVIRRTSIKNSGKNNCNAKQIICLNTKRRFDTIRQASKFYNVDDGSLCKACKGKQISSGFFNDERLAWMYYDEYLNTNDNEIIERIRKAQLYIDRKDIPRAKNIICITTEKVFITIKDGGTFYKIDTSGINNCCNKKRNYAGKLSDGTKLKWKYISDLTLEEYTSYDIYHKLNKLHNQELV